MFREVAQHTTAKWAEINLNLSFWLMPTIVLFYPRSKIYTLNFEIYNTG